MSGQKIFREYLLMVGLPALLLMGVLRMGLALEAPPTLNGRWLLAVGSAAEGRPSCAAPLELIDGNVLTISQSGLYLDGALGEDQPLALRGGIRGAQIWLDAQQDKQPTSAREPWRITGNLLETAGRRRIAGLLFQPMANECSPLAFQAVWTADEPARDAKGR